MRWVTQVTIGSLALTLACNAPETPGAPPVSAPVQASPPPAAPGLLSGTVAERIDASSYTYLRLATATGDEWVAVPKTDVAVGAVVTMADAALMQGFESRTLNRRFERIFFGNLVGQGGGRPAGHPSPGSTAAAPTDPKVARAEGPTARNVAEVWAQKQTLAGSQVTVRGTVVKFTAGVLGKNWLHLRDGSGSENTGDHDLTVTSATGEASIGDVVTIEGVVRLEQDFGAGYAYPVLVEDATIRR